jgi:hypothetical protein
MASAGAVSADATALAKEIKTQLKQARDLINQKDHNGALKICEVIFLITKYLYLDFDNFRDLLKKIKLVIQVG